MVPPTSRAWVVLSIITVLPFVVKAQPGSEGIDYQSSCDQYDTSSNYYTRTVGKSCKTITSTSTTPVPLTPIQSQPPVGIHITAGANADQVQFTTYPTSFASSVFKPTLPVTFYNNNGETQFGENNVKRWPYCASKNKNCHCKNGYISIMKIEGDSTSAFKISKDATHADAAGVT
jgi:hypothetical protein